MQHKVKCRQQNKKKTRALPCQRGLSACCKNLSPIVLNLCTVGMYCEGIKIVGEFTLFSKKILLLLKHSPIPIADPIIRGVIEVTFLDISPLNGRFGGF